MTQCISGFISPFSLQTSSQEVPSESLYNRVKKYFESPSEPQKTPSLIKKKLEVYDATQWTDLPGVSSLIFTPIDCICAIFDWIKADAEHNEEAKWALKVRFAAMPLSFFYGVFSFFTTVFQVGAFLKLNWELLPTHVLAAFAWPILALGIVIAAIGSALESFGIYKQVQLLTKLHDPANKETQYQDLAYIQENFFTLNLAEQALIELNGKDYNEEELLHVKKTTLAGRVHPWLVEKIETDLNKILRGLGSDDPLIRSVAHERAEKLLKSIDFQAKKKLMIHIIGLFALALTTIGLILTHTLCPPLVIFTLVGLGVFLGVSRMLLAKGFFSTEGWSFSAFNCLPEFIQKLFKIGEEEEYEMEELSINSDTPPLIELEEISCDYSSNELEEFSDGFSFSR
jgi:hypothetical protein